MFSLARFLPRTSLLLFSIRSMSRIVATLGTLVPVLLFSGVAEVFRVVL